MTPRWRCYDIFSGFWTISLPRDFLTFSPSLSTHCYPSSHPSMWAFFLGFLSARKLQYSLQSLSLSLILSVTCRPGKTIGSNLVSLSCCHGEWVSSANQQLYLWPAEENLGDPISCTHTWLDTCTQNTCKSTPLTHHPARHRTAHTQHKLTFTFPGLRVLFLFLAQAGAAVTGAQMHADIHVCNLVRTSKHVCIGETHALTQTLCKEEKVTMTSGPALKTEYS